MFLFFRPNININISLAPLIEKVEQLTVSGDSTTMIERVNQATLGGNIVNHGTPDSQSDQSDKEASGDEGEAHMEFESEHDMG